MLMLIITYSLAMSFLPRFSDQAMLRLHFVHALAWCLVHYVGLGYLLNAQSKNKYIVRHYMKNYHYSSNDGGGAIVEAFANWKSIYNLSMCMTYGKSYNRDALRCSDPFATSFVHRRGMENLCDSP